MKIFLTIFHIAPVAHVKSLSKAFLSFLLVASFLASCTTEDPASITDTGDGTVDPTVACPEGFVVLTLDGAGSLTLTDDLITVTAGEDFADAPRFTYEPAAVTAETMSVTVTATDTAGNTAMCEFDVRVREGAVTLSACPDDINNGIINTERRWTAPAIENDPEGATVAVSVTSDDAAVSTATVSETGGTFAEAGTYTVTFTATTADGTPIVGTDGAIFCSFDVTVNAMALPLRAICPEPSVTPISVILPFGEASVTLPDMPNGVSFTGGEGTVTFSYDPEMFVSTQVGTVITVTATAEDMATTPATDACTFTVMVTAGPEPMFRGCPSTTLTSEANTPVEWTDLTIENRPEGATIDASVTSADGNADTAMVTETTGIFFSTGTYTILFTARNNGEAIMVGENPSLLRCTFMVMVTAATLSAGSEFFLLTNNAAPASNNPFLIRDADDLEMLATVVNNADSNMFTDINGGTGNYREAAYRLESNIALSTTGVEDNFTPIGIGKTELVGSRNQVLMTTCDDTCFEGTFDGNSKTISGLRFSNNSENDAASTNVGLFAVISSSGEDASISSLVLTGVDITGRDNVGGFVGVMLGSASLNNVSAGGSVSGESTAGGLVGQMADSSSITNAFASSTVIGEGTLGGLVGEMINASSVVNAYASGTVGKGTGGFIGGLVGLLRGTSSLTNTLAWGAVEAGDNSVGGLGGFSAGNHIITNSYWNKSINMDTRKFSVTDPGRGQTTMELQEPTMAGESAGDIYFEWDSDIWDFGGTTDYPALSAMGFPVSVECQRDSTIMTCPNYSP